MYDHGQHGNAILSRYPIVSAENQDVSDHRYERRGLLHCDRSARTYPSALPLLRLDRSYARGFSAVRAEVRRGLPWSRISDHAALSAKLELS